MLDEKRNSSIQEVKNTLINRGLDIKSADFLLKEYSDLLDEWLNEYNITGSHLTPENFADNILQAKKLLEIKPYKKGDEIN